MKNKEQHISTVLLRGTITKLERSRRSHDFVLTQVQQRQVGATALGAAAMGMGAAGMGLVSMASNSDEEADWVEFELDGKKMQGWLWLLPMRNGDEVEVVAEKVADDRYIVYSVKRDGDDIVAMYPHATAGRKAHYRNMTKIMLWTFFVLYAILVVGTYFKGEISSDLYAYTVSMATIGVGGFIVFGIIFYRTSLKLMGFVRLAEAVFRTYGWPDVQNIDLRKTSREHRGTNTLSNYGRHYFRYKINVDPRA
ncbi:putative type VI secretion system effector [Paraburkholderia phytofirmans]|uniref:Transmembrane protein n=2 Tax=Paraburkholderia phytofirmans TaxID=261302 RepID=B2SZ82_PARPJ|nr:putative type VI secretion system effector [Paraburkholderia phytofirmans]ACD14461.1 conserved hypothetical protein [Paraburkholderia phytofirmans PsJN]